MKQDKSAKTTAITYTCPPELIRRFRDSSAEWKLNWLEEVNKFTNWILTKKEKEIRNKIRQGAIAPNEHQFVYETRKAGKAKTLKIGEKHRPAYGRLRGEQSRTPYGK